MSDEKKLGFHCYHLKPEDKHIAGWGARLLYDEVKQGGSGLLWDRQSGFGEERLIELEIWPVLTKFMSMVREWMLHNYSGSSSNDPLTLTDGKVTITGSPQGSYGYYYVTALLEK